VNKAGSEQLFIHKLFNIEIGLTQDATGATFCKQIWLTQVDIFGKRLRNLRSKTIN